MQKESNIQELGADDFARRFSLRAGNLMWLLGAGASASAGVPTAWDMIWEFKQQLYISQRRVSPQTVSDLSNPTIRSLLQAHIDSSRKLSLSGATDEYAALFESVYPAEADRRAYLDAKMGGAKPSYGHLALATLMLAQRTRLIWTTNFDTLIKLSWSDPRLDYPRLHSEANVRATLEKLVETGLLESHGIGRGRTYTLSVALYSKAGKKSEYIRQAGFAPIQQEQMVLSYIDKHGSIKRADVMELCHLDRNQAYRLLARMKAAKQIKQIGGQKGAIYERA